MKIGELTDTNDMPSIIFGNGDIFVCTGKHTDPKDGRCLILEKYKLPEKIGALEPTGDNEPIPEGSLYIQFKNKASAEVMLRAMNAIVDGFIEDESETP